MSDSQRLMTTNELARRLVLKPRGVEGLVAQGKMPAYKVSQRIVRCHWPEVKQALNRFRTKPTISAKGNRAG
jgi:excisionase family DNA binding protein